MELETFLTCLDVFQVLVSVNMDYELENECMLLELLYNTAY